MESKFLDILGNFRDEIPTYTFLLSLKCIPRIEIYQPFPKGNTVLETPRRPSPSWLEKKFSFKQSNILWYPGCTAKDDPCAFLKICTLSLSQRRVGFSQCIFFQTFQVWLTLKLSVRWFRESLLLNSSVKVDMAKEIAEATTLRRKASAVWFFFLQLRENFW